MTEPKKEEYTFEFFDDVILGQHVGAKAFLIKTIEDLDFDAVKDKRVTITFEKRFDKRKTVSRETDWVVRIREKVIRGDDEEGSA